MICDICGQSNAMIVVQQVSHNERKELHLCVSCAKERGITTDNKGLETTLASLFEHITQLKKRDRLCPVCGMSSSQIEKKGSVGCPECYNIFTDEIKKQLEAAGQGGPYTGSMPERLAHFKSVLTDRMLLKNKLEQSIANEEYEKAAMYRDRLKALDKCAVANGEMVYSQKFHRDLNDTHTNQQGSL